MIDFISKNPELYRKFLSNIRAVDSVAKDLDFQKGEQGEEGELITYNYNSSAIFNPVVTFEQDTPFITIGPKNIKPNSTISEISSCLTNIVKLAIKEPDTKKSDQNATIIYNYIKSMFDSETDKGISVYKICLAFLFNIRHKLFMLKENTSSKSLPIWRITNARTKYIMSELRIDSVVRLQKLSKTQSITLASYDIQTVSDIINKVCEKFIKHLSTKNKNASVTQTNILTDEISGAIYYLQFPNLLDIITVYVRNIYPKKNDLIKIISIIKELMNPDHPNYVLKYNAENKTFDIRGNYNSHKISDEPEELNIDTRTSAGNLGNLQEGISDTKSKSSTGSLKRLSNELFDMLSLSPKKNR